jgi:hypothetical protein
VGPRAVLDAVVKRKIPSPRPESNPRTPLVQRNGKPNRIALAVRISGCAMGWKIFHIKFPEQAKNSIRYVALWRGGGVIVALICFFLYYLEAKNGGSEVRSV